MEKHIFVLRVINLSSIIDVRVLNRNKVIIHPFIHEYVCMYVCISTEKEIRLRTTYAHQTEALLSQRSGRRHRSVFRFFSR
jgi:hypothetical protein